MIEAREFQLSNKVQKFIKLIKVDKKRYLKKWYECDKCKVRKFCKYLKIILKNAIYLLINFFSNRLTEEVTIVQL